MLAWFQSKWLTKLSCPALVIHVSMKIETYSSLSCAMASIVARAFPGGQLAHPEGQKWGKKWEKFEEKSEKCIKIWGNDEESGNLAHTPGIVKLATSLHGTHFSRSCHVVYSTQDRYVFEELLHRWARFHRYRDTYLGPARRTIGYCQAGDIMQVELHDTVDGNSMVDCGLVNLTFTWWLPVTGTEYGHRNNFYDNLYSYRQVYYYTWSVLPYRILIILLKNGQLIIVFVSDSCTQGRVFHTW